MDIQKMIEEQVMEALGEISDFKEIRIHNVFDNRHRVDVWCDYQPDGCITEFLGQQIKYSYFVRVDEEGNITRSDPELGTKTQTKFRGSKLPFRDN
jgi:hypothetical protein